MSVMRFTGVNSREAMRQVRAALGDDALILANRPTEEGVEILAMADRGVEATLDAPALSEVAPPARSEPRPVADPAAGTLQALSAQLLQEMQDMRQLLSRQRTASKETTQAGARLVQWLRESGFGAALCDELLAGFPEELESADEAMLRAWLVRQLSARLPVLEGEEGLLGQGGVLALVGPTGVGKTTTTAKLAARYVMRHGAAQVALVSTDGFRIGAHEQLRIYAELLGIPMYGLDARAPLDELRDELAGKRFVIVDTVGMSQRDRGIIEQVARLRGGPVAVRPILLLNAASQPETLDEVITNYRRAAHAAGVSLDDCVISKQDEASRLGPLLDAVMRHGLRLLFVATGQRVPEDLALAVASPLVEQALAHGEPTMDGPEPPVSRGASYGLLSQGRRLALILEGLRERVSDFTVLEQAWALAALPASLQETRLGALRQAHAGCRASGLLWTPRGRVRGADWPLPDLLLDAQGAWSALPSLQHLQPPGESERLAWAATHHGARVHLLPTPPATDARRWLTRQGATWVAQARPNQREAYGGERRSLAELAALASPLGESTRRWKGRQVQVRLARLELDPVLPDDAAHAWFADLRDPDDGRYLGRRCWLAPARLGDMAVPYLLGQLDAECLPRLVRQAHARLGETPPGLDHELRRLLAGGLAAVAGQLERSQAEWAMDLRADLLGLLGARRRRSAETLLEALLYLGQARDAVRALGAAGWETLNG